MISFVYISYGTGIDLWFFWNLNHFVKFDYNISSDIFFIEFFLNILNFC